MKKIITLLLLLAVLTACTPQTPPPGEGVAAPTTSGLIAEQPTATTAAEQPTDPPAATADTGSPAPAGQPGGLAFERAAALGRGVNFGNALEADFEGQWGVTLQAEYFPMIAEKGFQTVRVPIRWQSHAAETAPYTIDPAFFERIDWIVEQSTANNLNVILDFHHFWQYMENPTGEKARFLGIWQQIAEHYAAAPDSVYFELLNEPQNQVDGATWNQALAEAITLIRQSNPTRTLIAGPVFWNGLDGLPELQIPAEEQNLIVTIHFYEPFDFTHQGAEWNPEAANWLGKQWTANEEEQFGITYRLGLAAEWAKQNNRPLLLGEFGVYHKADMDSRVRWTEFVAREVERLGMVWTYWEFCSGYGVFDPATGQWREELLRALIPEG